VLTAVLLVPAVTLGRLHPYEYLYFNPLVRGLAGANRNYDTDYWVNIMPEAVHALEAFVAKTDGATPRAHAVGVCGDHTSFMHELKPGSLLETTDDWDNADFFISPTQMDCCRIQ